MPYNWTASQSFIQPERLHSFSLSCSLCHSVCLVVGVCPSRLAVDWQSVDLSVSGTGGLLSQHSSLPPADRQGQGLIPPVFLGSWQPFLGETNPRQPCTAWHAPSPINIASPFSSPLPLRSASLGATGPPDSLVSWPHSASMNNGGKADWSTCFTHLCCCWRC